MTGSDVAAGVLDALDVLSGRPGGGCVAMLISGDAGEGTSPLARAVAWAFATQTRKPCLLVDLDVLSDGQHDAFAAWAEAGGPALGPTRDGRLKGQSFFTLRDGAEPGEAALGVRRVGDTSLFVTHLHRPPDRPTVRAGILAGAGYWQAAREACGLVVVDAPSLARSRASLAAARAMDGVIQVVSGLRGTAAGAVAARDQLERSGAEILGLVYTDADRPAAKRAS